jgi:hypothetical protein
VFWGAYIPTGVDMSDMFKVSLSFSVYYGDLIYDLLRKCSPYVLRNSMRYRRI